MENKKIILIFIAIVIISSILFLVLNNKKQESQLPIKMDKTKNEITGKEEYIIYDKNTNKRITTFNEVDKYKIKIYELNPNYEEINVEEDISHE